MILLVNPNSQRTAIESFTTVKGTPKDYEMSNTLKEGSILSKTLTKVF